MITDDRKYYLKMCLVGYPLWLVLFGLVGTYAQHLDTVDLTLWLDRQIPLVPAFVWPYHVAYAMPLALVFVITDRARFDQAILSFFGATLVGLVFYILLPVAFPRPELGTTISEKFLLGAYSVDFSPGANKLPSLHVALAWIVFMASLRQRPGRIIELAMLIVAVTISVSTLFVKQHVVLDVASGTILGFAAWSGTGLLMRRAGSRVGSSGCLVSTIRLVAPALVLYLVCFLLLIVWTELG